MCEWSQTTAEALQNQNIFTRKIWKPEMGLLHGFFNPNTIFTAKPTPKFVSKNKSFVGYSGLNHISAWVQTIVEAFQSRHWFTSKDYQAWDWNWMSHLKPTTGFSAKLTPSFWPKMSSSRAELAQLTCVNCFSLLLLQEHSKFEIGSSVRLTKPGMWILHVI